MKLAIEPKLEAFLGRRLAPVTELQPQIEFSSTYGLFVSDARVRFPDRIGGAPISPMAGRGQSQRLDRSVNSAIAEALERHAATCAPKAATIRGSYASLNERLPLVSPRELRLYSDSQIASPGFELRNIDDNDVVDWIEGREKTAAGWKPVYYPFQRLTLLHSRNEGYERSTSNGFCLHTSLDRAVEGALAEMLERTSLLEHWWFRKPARALYTVDDVASFVGRETRELLDWMRERLAILDLSDRWEVPAFLALVRGNVAKGEPALVIGAACHSDPLVAIEKCAQESTRLFLELIEITKKHGAPTPQPPYDISVAEFEHVAALFSTEMARAQTEFLRDAPRPGRAGLEKILVKGTIDLHAAVLARGARLLAFDLTPVDLAEAGLSLARVIIPEAIPLNCSHRTRPLGCLALDGRDINPFPHPMV